MSKEFKPSYDNVLACIEDNREAFKDKYYFNQMHREITKRRDIGEVEKKFGFELPHDSDSSNYIELDYDGNRVVMYCLENRQYISWSDDGKKPSNEWLYVIRFPTGAYYFGDHYPEEVFKAFFNELKEYKPKYSDTRNRTLYFSPDNAVVIHAVFKDIVKKYADKSAEEYKRQKAEKLRKELEALEND